MIDSKTHVDMTEEFEEYQNGKTVTCVCGHKIGITLNQRSVKCPRCNKVLFDEKWDSREPPKTDSGQTTLGDW